MIYTRVKSDSSKYEEGRQPGGVRAQNDTSTCLSGPIDKEIGSITQDLGALEEWPCQLSRHFTVAITRDHINTVRHWYSSAQDPARSNV